MTIRYKLKSPVGMNHDTDPDDVWVIKKTLNLNGFYDEPNQGMTPFPDEALFSGIKRFQRQFGLTVDGLMNPDGETERHMQQHLAAMPTYRCVYCGAPHGGVYSPNVCWQCWSKGLR